MCGLLAGLLVLLPAAAPAGPVIDRVRQAGVLECGGVIRPGLAFPALDGSWHGLEVDICRAIAVAVLGSQGRFVFHGYSEAAAGYDPLRRGEHELAFLTASEMLAQTLIASLVPGPPVFFTASGVIVHAGSPAVGLKDLAGQRVCVEPGTGPERVLGAWFAAHGVRAQLVPFQEAEEMQDGFYSGHCDAMANELPRLASLRLQAEADRHPARLLRDAVGADPILAATPASDGAWSAVVAWAIATLQRAETLGQPGPGGGSDPLPLAGAALGLAPGWQATMLAATGHYAALYDRNLGAGSPLELPRGLNALWTAGGLFCPPFSE